MGKKGEPRSLCCFITNGGNVKPLYAYLFIIPCGFVEQDMYFFLFFHVTQWCANHSLLYVWWRKKDFSLFHVTNKEINKSLWTLTGGGKAAHLSLSIYEVVASLTAFLLTLKYLHMCMCGEHCTTRRGGLVARHAKQPEAFSSRAPYTHYPLHTTWATEQHLALQCISFQIPSLYLFVSREEGENHLFKSVKWNSWRDIMATGLSRTGLLKLFSFKSVNKKLKVHISHPSPP